MSGGFTHLLVAIDKFFKWIEARPVTKIKSQQAVEFFTDIVHRFGVLNTIITDNGTQFTGKKFLVFCDSYNIRVDWSAVAHPQMNGQVERANGMILQGLKPRIFNKLNKFGRRWLTELPSVIWSLRMTPSRATGFMWQNHLNYPGSSAMAITNKATPTQTHFKRNNSWSVR